MKVKISQLFRTLNVEFVGVVCAFALACLPSLWILGNLFNTCQNFAQMLPIYLYFLVAVVLLVAAIIFIILKLIIKRKWSRRAGKLLAGVLLNLAFFMILSTGLTLARSYLSTQAEHKIHSIKNLVEQYYEKQGTFPQSLKDIGESDYIVTDIPYFKVQYYLEKPTELHENQRAAISLFTSITHALTTEEKANNSYSSDLDIVPGCGW